jgi:hypothetical protein
LILPYEILVCLTVVVSCITFAALLRSLPEDKQSRHYPFLIAAYALFNLLIGPEFGSAEHLLLLFCTPYLFLRMVRAHDARAPRKLSIAVGVAAGIGFNLDWIFLLIPCIFEIFYLIDGAKNWRRFLKAPEIVSVLTVTALYLLHFLCLNKAELSNYVNIVAPLSRAMCEIPDFVLGFVTKSPDRREVIYIFLAALMSSFLLRTRCSFMMPLTVFAFAGLEIYIYRGLGFSHELLPLILACTLITALSLSIAFDQGVKRIKLPERAQAQSASALIVIAGVLSMAAYAQLQSALFNLHDAKTGAALSELSPFAVRLSAITNQGDRVLFINGFERPAYPTIVQLGLEPASPWLYQFPVRAFLKLEQHAFDNPYCYLLTYKRAYDAQLRQVIAQRPPKIVAIQSGEVGLLFETPEFRQLMHEYTIDPELNYNIYGEYQNMEQHHLEVVGDQYAFTVYRRRPEFEEFSHSQNKAGGDH